MVFLFVSLSVRNPVYIFLRVWPYILLVVNDLFNKRDFDLEHGSLKTVLSYGSEDI